MIEVSFTKRKVRVTLLQQPTVAVLPSREILCHTFEESLPIFPRSNNKNIFKLICYFNKKKYLAL